MKKISLFFLLIFPVLAEAAGLFDVPGSDQSVKYLTQVFGKIDYLPNFSGGDNRLFGDLMLKFSSAILSLSLIIAAYVFIVSTLKTAHEGEVMGKKWSAIFIPARIGAGLWLLTPTTSGYSTIQIIFMWCLLQGIGVANNLWEQILVSIDQGNAVVKNQDAADLGDDGNDTTLIKQIFKSQLCMALVNKDSPDTVTLFKSLNNNRLIWGTRRSETAICGTLGLPEKSTLNRLYNINIAADEATPASDKYNIKETYANLMISSAQDLASAADTVATTEPNTWSAINFRVFSDVQQKITASKKTMQTALDTGGKTLKDDKLQQAKVDGWIAAGTFYFKLARAQQSGSVSINIPPTYTEPDLSTLGSSGKDIKEKMEKLYKAALAEKKRSIDNYVIVTQTKGLAVHSANYFSVLTAPLRTITRGLTTNAGDPILSISNQGGKLITGAEALAMALIAMIGVSAALAICKGMAPTDAVAQVLKSFVIPIMIIFLGLLLVAGITFALYIPLIPMLVFTFSAIGWMILVIEAMVAAPLVAMILLVPSEDELGKATHALIILLGLTMRPALMLIGFIFSIKILKFSLDLVNFGFDNIVQHQVPDASVFYDIAAIGLYVGIVTHIVHESFALIYSLPDKILTWIGGQAEHSDAMGKVQTVKKAADSGAAQTKKHAEAGAAKLGQLASMADKDDQ